MKTYTIKRVDEKPTNWDGISKAKIDAYQWMDNGYAPRVEAAICYDEKAIYVKFWVYETEIRGTWRNHHDNVWEDSCVEFFFRPISDPRYMNIETNVLGAQLIGLGECRQSRIKVPVDDSVMQIEASVKDASTYKDDVWTIEYNVPFSLLRAYYGETDILEGLYANLFKCGDFTRFEHYGMWNPIDTPKPDFHRPEQFGKMEFEK